MKHSITFVTAPNAKVAEKIARALVDRELLLDVLTDAWEGKAPERLLGGDE